MGKTTWTFLRDLLVERYDDFKIRLTRRLGSAELACESLHETWLRLDRGDAPAGDSVPVENPAAYVMRTAVNVATDRLRSENRLVRRSTTLSLLEIADSAPDPARQIEGREQFSTLKQAIDALPERSREILIAARLQGLSQQQIADRFGLSTRTVRTELRRALDFCEARLKKNDEEDFLSRPAQSSIGRGEKPSRDSDEAAGDRMGREPENDDDPHG